MDTKIGINRNAVRVMRNIAMLDVAPIAPMMANSPPRWVTWLRVSDSWDKNYASQPRKDMLPVQEAAAEQAARIILTALDIIFITGAGISTSAGRK